jgi:hypothetical protein
LTREFVENRREAREHSGVLQDLRRRRGRRKAGQLATPYHVRKHQGGSELPILARDDDILGESGSLHQDSRAKWSDADPCAGRQLEVLGQASVECQSLVRI